MKVALDLNSKCTISAKLKQLEERGWIEKMNGKNRSIRVTKMKTIILGPPGTGKTTTLLNLVDEFLKNGIRPKQIGYFSFTKKAATEAADRAADKFGLDKENDLPFLELYIHTLLIN